MYKEMISKEEEVYEFQELVTRDHLEHVVDEFHF